MLVGSECHVSLRTPFVEWYRSRLRFELGSLGSTPASGPVASLFSTAAASTMSVDCCLPLMLSVVLRAHRGGWLFLASVSFLLDAFL